MLIVLSVLFVISVLLFFCLLNVEHCDKDIAKEYDFIFYSTFIKVEYYNNFLEFIQSLDTSIFLTDPSY